MENTLQKASAQIANAQYVDYRKKATEWLKTVNAGLSPSQATQFIEIAAEFGLNPYKREIYGVSYNGQLTIITGYLSYLKRAERSGLMDGWEFNVEPIGDDLKGTLTIYRKDWSKPFKHVVYYSECYQATKDGKPNQFWAKRPKFMLEKCAIAQGFRICFPDEFSGMPYMEDEMPTPDEEIKPEGTVTITVPQTQPQPTPQQKPQKTEEEKEIDAKLAILAKDPLWSKEELANLKKLFATTPRKEILAIMEAELAQKRNGNEPNQDLFSSPEPPF